MTTAAVDGQVSPQKLGYCSAAEVPHGLPARETLGGIPIVVQDGCTAALWSEEGHEPVLFLPRERGAWEPAPARYVEHVDENVEACQEEHVQHADTTHRHEMTTTHSYRQPRGDGSPLIQNPETMLRQEEGEGRRRALMMAASEAWGPGV